MNECDLLSIIVPLDALEAIEYLAANDNEISDILLAVGSLFINVVEGEHDLALLIIVGL